MKPGGTFYIFPKALEEDAKVFSQKALKYDLVLVPGDSFGAPGYFRMAYCVDTIPGSVAEVCEDEYHLESRSISKANRACTNEPFDMLMWFWIVQKRKGE